MIACRSEKSGFVVELASGCFESTAVRRFWVILPMRLGDMRMKERASYYISIRERERCLI